MSVNPVELPSRPSPGAAGARLGELYAAHARMVHGICRLILRNPTDTEDATQQVFLLAYRSLLAGTSVDNPGAWLGTIARNECRGRVAARMREPLQMGDSPRLVSPAAEDQAVDRAELAELYAELAALPEKQRDAVVLRDLFGLRYDEVATALGTSRPAAEALLFRGRRRLQRRLRPSFVAGALAVPLAIQESLAYAVPGFASTAAPAGAAGAAAAVPLFIKLAAGGAAAVLAGSAGVVFEQEMHDRPGSPSRTVTVPSGTSPGAAVAAALSVGSDEAETARDRSFVHPAEDEPGIVSWARAVPVAEAGEERSSGTPKQQPRAPTSAAAADEPEDTDEKRKEGDEGSDARPDGGPKSDSGPEPPEDEEPQIYASEAALESANDSEWGSRDETEIEGDHDSADAAEVDEAGLDSWSDESSGDQADD